MKKIFILPLLLLVLVSNAQVLDTLRIDTCFNVGFQKKQIDMYYLEQVEDDILLKRQRIIEGIKGFPVQVHEKLFTEHKFIKVDKRGSFKDGDADTSYVGLGPMDSSLNYMQIRDFYFEPTLEKVAFKTRYVVHNGKNYFYDFHPTGPIFRKVLLDSAGKMIAEFSNNQLDSLGVSFMQMDSSGKVVVYQKRSFVQKWYSNMVLDFSYQQVFAKYQNGVIAFKEYKLNDSTWRKEVYTRSGDLKTALEIEYREVIDKELSTPQDLVWMIGKIIQRKDYVNGELIIEK